jgi:hypothetical protein
MESIASLLGVFCKGSKTRDFHDFRALPPGFAEFDRFKVGFEKLYFSATAMLTLMLMQKLKD